MKQITYKKGDTFTTMKPHGRGPWHYRYSGDTCYMLPENTPCRSGGPGHTERVTTLPEVTAAMRALGYEMVEADAPDIVVTKMKNVELIDAKVVDKHGNSRPAKVKYQLPPEPVAGASEQPAPFEPKVGAVAKSDDDKRRVPVGARVKYDYEPESADCTVIEPIHEREDCTLCLRHTRGESMWSGNGGDWTILSLPGEASEVESLRAQLAEANDTIESFKSAARNDLGTITSLRKELAAAVSRAERAERALQGAQDACGIVHAQLIESRKCRDTAEARVRELEAKATPTQTREVRLYTLIGRHGNIVPFMDRAKRDTKAIQWGEAHGPDQLVTEVIP